MQDPGRVRRCQPVAHAHQQVDDLPPRPRLRPGPILERAAVDELGDQILPAVDLAGIVHRENVRMVERGRHLRFLLKAAARRFVSKVW